MKAPRLLKDGTNGVRAGPMIVAINYEPGLLEAIGIDGLETLDFAAEGLSEGETTITASDRYDGYVILEHRGDHIWARLASDEEAEAMLDDGYEGDDE